MRLLFIRHGDPDYEHDTLTGKGIEEAKALAGLIPHLNVGDCYVFPLGRAASRSGISPGVHERDLRVCRCEVCEMRG